MGPGFDVVAAAIKNLHDIVEVEVSHGVGSIHVESKGFNAPQGSSNVAYHVARAFVDELGLWNYNILIRIVKGVPPGYGLGSSGATAAGTIKALSYAFGVDLSEDKLLYYAGIGEQYVAGVPHYDNAAASLFGGFVILDLTCKQVFKYAPRREIPVVIVAPKVNYGGLRGKTEYARSILPRTINLELHVKQSSAIAKLVYAILTEDLKLLGEAVSIDHVVEPHRAKLIPLYMEVKKIALGEGAFGFNISGAGPSMFIIHEDEGKAYSIALKIKSFYEGEGVESELFSSSISSVGAEVIEAYE